MQYETVLGLRKRHTFDEARRYVQTDPDTIQYPKRDALFLQKSHIYAQVEASMRNYGEDAQLDQARYRASGQGAPYVPPKPKPPRDAPMGDPTAPDPLDDPASDPVVTMDDQIAGGPAPPPGGAGGYAQWLQGPNATAQGLAAEGVQPAPPPPPPLAGS